MSIQKPIQTFTAIAAAVTIIIACYDWVASKEYVSETTQEVANPISKDVKRLLAMNIAQQIGELRRYNCNNPNDSQFVSMLNEKKLEYKELTGRDFLEAPCSNL
jgi:archaellin